MRNWKTRLDNAYRVGTDEDSRKIRGRTRESKKVAWLEKFIALNRFAVARFVVLFRCVVVSLPLCVFIPIFLLLED